MVASPRYRHAGLVLVRASTDPGDLDPPAHLNPFDAEAVECEGWAWLVKVWARPEVREALWLASPALAERLDQMLAAPASSGSIKDLRRAVVSVASYLLRWQRRATPYGLFAGITTASIGAARAELDVKHQAVVRADAEWLSTLIDRLERHHGLRPRLTVVADNARIVRDGRVIVHRRAEVGASAPGPLREASVRHTRPVQFALAQAGAPIRFDALATRIAARFPAVSPDKIHDLLHNLVDGGLLITNLRPPMTAPDALSHLIGALRAAGAEALPQIADVLRELVEIGSMMTCHNSTGEPGEALTIREALSARMRALAAGAGPLLAVDMRLDAQIAVPASVLAEAARAASVLLRTATQPFGSAGWLDYHARFLTRYGPGALVPVAELVADSGLGYPGGYLGAPRARPAWRMVTERDAALLALIQEATLDGASEILLSDADVEALTVGDHADVVAPQRIELGVAVRAASTEALDRGEFLVQVTASPRTPTSMAGRFAHLLDDTDRDRLAATYAAQPEESAPVAVQLSFPPRRLHNENVVRVPPLLPDVVALSEHPDPAAASFDVDDLAVTADAEQMYLVQRSTGRRVIPRIPHALDTIAQTPPLARFLAEVADARSAVFRGFDLGVARTLPYVPRIRYRRTILSAARWILTAADAGPEPQAALPVSRARWRVPVRVVLVDGELRLPLDLGHELDRALLAARLARAGRVELHEDGPPDAHGWIGRPAELLIPMTTINPPTRRLPAIVPPGAVLRPGDSALVHAQLAGHPARFDDILTTHLPTLADALSEMVELWWVRRHRDMIRPDTDQHLAVFLRLTSPHDYGPVAATLAGFATELQERGLPCQLTLASTPQHPGRYGQGRALAAAEQVFATDTAAAIAQIIASQVSGIPAQALAAVSMAHLAADFAPDPATGWRALVDCLHQEHGRLERTLRDHALTLANPDVACDLPGGEAVSTAWHTRAAALHTYRDALVQQQRKPTTVLRTLLHEHHMRAVGVDPTIEKETGRLARAIAQRRLALAAQR